MSRFEEIAKQLLEEELKYIKENSKKVWKEYEWNKLDSFSMKHINRLTVSDEAIQRLSTKIEFDYAFNNLWIHDENDECKYDPLMMAEYIDDIMRDFIYQIKSFTVGIPLDF